MKLGEFFRKIKEKPLRKSDWLILVLAGILLMIVVLPFDSGKEKKPGKTEAEKKQEEMQAGTTGKAYEADDMEEKLEAILGQIEGVGEVQVMITYEDGGTQVVEKDEQVSSNTTTETDSAGGTRKTNDIQSQKNTVYDEADGENTPFIAKELTPKIEGVLVVAAGGDNKVVKQNISEAVLALFHVDAHRIKIVKMNRQEGGE